MTAQMTHDRLEDKLHELGFEFRVLQRSNVMLENKTNRLEQEFEHQHTQLNKIEDKVNKIEQKVEDKFNKVESVLAEIQRKLNESEGVSKFKNKLANNVYMLITIILAFLANDYIIKKLFGS